MLFKLGEKSPLGDLDSEEEVVWERAVFEASPVIPASRAHQEVSP